MPLRPENERCCEEDPANVSVAPAIQNSEFRIQNFLSAMPRKIALATDREHVDLHADDQLVLGPLRELGIEAEAVVWDYPQAQWDRYDAVIIRSCWDYSWRLTEFLTWLGQLEEQKLPVWNTPETIGRNVDKRYLRTLESAGIDTVPTIWIERGEDPDLPTLMAKYGWRDAVVKPTVSAGGRETWKVSQNRPTPNQTGIQALATQRGFMVQPFLREICMEGEWSFVFFGGDFSHSVLKRPASGDFRVQERYGGTAMPASIPASALLAQAYLALELLADKSVYARVDGIRVRDQLMIMEVELTEPRLFLAEDRQAPMRFAKAIAAVLSKTGSAA